MRLAEAVLVVLTEYDIVTPRRRKESQSPLAQTITPAGRREKKRQQDMLCCVKL